MQEQMTKYGYTIANDAIVKNSNRLTNQLWKLIPMRENNEDWVGHLTGLVIEISGLNEVFRNQSAYISLISKLEGLLIKDTEFLVYRKIVFESISLLREILK